MRSAFFMLFIIYLTCISCSISLSGIAIPEEMESFRVEVFDNRANQAPVDLGQTFSEALKEKILRETRLTYSELEPDIIFSGQIARYQVSAQAPQPDEQVGFNRLSIGIKVHLENNLDSEGSWDNSFSFYQDYGSDVNLLDRQDDLIDAINEQLLEDIFNKAFTNW